MRKRDRLAKFVGFYGTPALKRDLWRIAKAEDRSLSQTVCALLRLGIGRYFELADEQMIAPLRAMMKEALGDGSFADAAGEPRGLGAREFLDRRAAREQNAREFDAAVDDGLQAFVGRANVNRLSETRPHPARDVLPRVAPGRGYTRG
ncbi:MAG: hypothetical protein WBX26_01590 [Candidatus Cybelea sp.]